MGFTPSLPFPVWVIHVYHLAIISMSFQRCRTVFLDDRYYQIHVNGATLQVIMASGRCFKVTLALLGSFYLLLASIFAILQGCVPLWSASASAVNISSVEFLRPVNLIN